MIEIGIWPTTISTGIADGIADPCGISVLIFLIAYMIELNSKKKVIAYGLLYSFMIAVIYFVFMVGLLDALALIPYVTAIKAVVALVLVIWGALEIKNFLMPGKGIVVEMPHRVKAAAGELIEKATLPAVLALGVLVAVGDIPCASGWAIFYDTYLRTHYIVGAAAIFFLVIYNFFMVLPLIIITLLLYFGMEKIEAVKRKGQNIKQYLHLITGILFILIAILLFVWV